MPNKLCWQLRWALSALPLLVGGCADGPVPETKYWNPWVRKQWAEDDARALTFHRKVEDLDKLRSRAAKMPAEEREQTASHLAARLREERSPVLRAAFVRTLGAFDTPAAHQALVACMSDDAANVRVVACSALSKYRTPAGFQALSQAVASDSDLDVKIAAARELGNFRDFEAPKALRPALDERDPALQLAAMQSLEQVAGHTEYRRNIAVWREHLDGQNPAPPPPPSIAELTRQYWSWF